MVAWMMHRGMGWKNSSEMAAVMVVPVVLFLCLVWFDVTKSAQCGAYCALTVVAMLALMRYRAPSTPCRCSRRRTAVATPPVSYGVGALAILVPKMPIADYSRPYDSCVLEGKVNVELGVPVQERRGRTGLHGGVHGHHAAMAGAI